MKKLLLIIMVVSLFTSVFADDYEILYMNTKTIKIGKRIYKKGDSFSDDRIPHIHWSNDKQVLEVENKRTKEIKLLVGPAFQKKQSKSFFKAFMDHFFKECFLETRGMGDDIEDMKKMLPDTLYMLNDIRIKPNVPVNNTCYFYIAFQEGEKKVQKILPMQNEQLIIDRSIFPMADSSSEIRISMAYSCNGIDEDYLLTDSMRIVFIPQNIDNE